MWESQHAQGLPPPLTFTSRTPLLDDFRREVAATQDAMSNRLDRELRAALEVLRNPDILLQVDAFHPENLDDAAARVGIYAARRGDAAAVVTQQPGETIWHSKGFEVLECEALGLARHLAAGLPELPAGQMGAVTLAGNDMEYDYGTSRVRDTVEASESQRATEFRQHPVVRTGAITVVQGHSRFGPRGVTRRVIEWRDLVDDGRYVITPTQPDVATGADEPALVAAINTEIAEVVRAIRDERN